MSARTSAPARRRPSRGARVAYGVLGVVGELLITLGVLVLAFLVWQLWWTDVEGNAAQAEIVRELGFAPPVVAEEDDGVAEPRRDEPPVIDEPEHAVSFATLQVPRWAGDANFITVVGETKVIPQLLRDTRKLLADEWAAQS